MNEPGKCELFSHWMVRSIFHFAANCFREIRLAPQKIWTNGVWWKCICTTHINFNSVWVDVSRCQSMLVAAFHLIFFPTKICIEFDLCGYACWHIARAHTVCNGNRSRFNMFGNLLNTWDVSFDRYEPINFNRTSNFFINDEWQYCEVGIVLLDTNLKSNDW